jgi:outer membrane protein OmpA-like peptidoglycan-associated protein
MTTINASNTWRWIGLVSIFLVLLILWLIGLGPSFSGSEAGCCGVQVAGQQTSAAPAPVSQSAVHVAFQSNGSIVTLTGEVPSEADRHNAFNAAMAVFGSANVVDNLTVWKNASLPGWWKNIGNVLTWVKGGADFGLSQQDKIVTLTGAAASDAIKLTKETAAKALLGDNLNINNQMLVESASLANIPDSSPPANPPKEMASPCSGDMNVAISFKIGSAELSVNDKDQLKQIAQCLTTKTELAGHTDNVGNDAFNQKLSKARATAVKTYITGIDPGKGKLLTVRGHGKTKPIADNGTEEGRAKNRRIEFSAK